MGENNITLDEQSRSYYLAILGFLKNLDVKGSICDAEPNKGWYAKEITVAKDINIDSLVKNLNILVAQSGVDDIIFRKSKELHKIQCVVPNKLSLDIKATGVREFIADIPSSSAQKTESDEKTQKTFASTAEERRAKQKTAKLCSKKAILDSFVSNLDDERVRYGEVKWRTSVLAR